MSYVIAHNLRGPDELGKDRDGIPADWHVDLVNKARKPAHYICMQFGSIAFSRDEADKLVASILAGLNGTQVVS